MTLQYCNMSIDPVYIVCYDGEIDTAVTTADGETYIFKYKWYWKLNKELTQVVGNASLIGKDWDGLADNLKVAFYISGNRMPLNNYTFFIRDNIWYQFLNKKLISNGTTDIWLDFISDLRYAVVVVNDPIIVFYSKPRKLFPTPERIAYYFDNPKFPEKRNIKWTTHPFGAHTRAVITYSDHSLLVFFDDNVRIGEHCYLKDYYSTCYPRENQDFFQCPNGIRSLVRKNAFIEAWHFSGLNLREFSLLIVSFLLAILFVFIYLCIILGFKFNNALYNRRRLKAIERITKQNQIN